MSNFWLQFPRPIWCLAPMEGVTDVVFRSIITSLGQVDVVFSEFTNVTGLLSQGSAEVQKNLKFNNDEHPIVAQLWGTNPDHFFQAAMMIIKMGFDGIDINMGCPDRNVVKKGSGAALINNFNLSAQIISSVKKATKGKIPLSVKTRIGFDHPITEKWTTFLLNQELDALTVHARTAKQLSKVAANWSEIAKVVQIKRQLQSPTVIIGNGDIKTRSQAINHISKTQVDGIMIGRGVFSNPLIFNPQISFTDYSPKQKLELLLRHAKLFEQTWSDQKPFHVIKRFFKIYCTGFKGATILRDQLMRSAVNYHTTEEIVKKFPAMI